MKDVRKLNKSLQAIIEKVYEEKKVERDHSTSMRMLEEADSDSEDDLDDEFQRVSAELRDDFSRRAQLYSVQGGAFMSEKKASPLKTKIKKSLQKIADMRAERPGKAKAF